MSMELERTEPLPTSAPTGGTGAWGGWIATLGLGIGSLGAAFVLLPGGLEGWAPVRAALVKHGGTPLSLLLAGGILTALGLVARGLSRASREQRQAIDGLPSSTPQLEQLLSEIAQVRGVLQELRVGSVYLRDGLKTIEQRLVVDLDPSSRDGLQAAVFQMAGSLDQATARIEERILLQDTEARRSTQAFHDALLTACGRIDELHSRVSVVAEAALILSQGRIGTPTTGSLGVLDLLDDPVVTQPLPTVAAASRSPAEPRGPLPVLVLSDKVVANKVANLQALLADDRVREALVEMQRLQTP